MQRIGNALLDISSHTTRRSTTRLGPAFSTLSSRLNDAELPTPGTSTCVSTHWTVSYGNEESHWDDAKGHDTEAEWTRKQTPKPQVDDTSSFAREFQKPRMDASFLVNNYTAPALAAAYQDREYTLWRCAELLSEGKLDQLEAVLKPYHGTPKSLSRPGSRCIICTHCACFFHCRV